MQKSINAVLVYTDVTDDSRGHVTQQTAWCVSWKQAIGGFGYGHGVVTGLAILVIFGGPCMMLRTYAKLLLSYTARYSNKNA